MRRPATRDDHEAFCTAEGWAAVTNARGARVRHHATSELPLPDGSVLRTRIFRPVDATTYGPSIWSHILRDQLCVAADVFWTCVDDGGLPDRGAAPATTESLPAGLVFTALRELGLTDDDLAGMTRADLIERLQAHWSTPPE